MLREAVVGGPMLHWRAAEVHKWHLRRVALLPRRQVRDGGECGLVLVRGALADTQQPHAAIVCELKDRRWRLEASPPTVSGCTMGIDAA